MITVVRRGRRAARRLGGSLTRFYIVCSLAATAAAAVETAYARVTPADVIIAGLSWLMTYQQWREDRCPIGHRAHTGDAVIAPDPLITPRDVVLDADMYGTAFLQISRHDDGTCTYAVIDPTRVAILRDTP